MEATQVSTALVSEFTIFDQLIQFNNLKAGSLEWTGQQYVQYVSEELANGTENVETAVADVTVGYVAQGESADDSTWLTDAASTELDEQDASQLSFASSLAAFAVAFSVMNV